MHVHVSVRHCMCVCVCVRVCMPVYARSVKLLV